MKKRLLSILLAFCLALTLMPSAALADGDAAVTAGNADAKVGETVRIPVTLTSNPGIAALLFEFSYDEDLLTLQAIEQGEVFSGGAFSSSTEMKNVQWYDASGNATATGVMFTLVFDAVGRGSAKVTVALADSEPSNLVNIDGDVVPVTFTDGTISIASDTAVYTITYDANGGVGTMTADTATEGEAFTLPACTFTAPADKEFKAWQINGAEYAPGVSYTFTADTTVTAVWQDKVVPPPTPTHTHSWAVTWSSNTTHHWHECGADSCPITANSGKDGYGTHVYDNDMDTTCNTCGYTRTVTPPTPTHTHSWAAVWTNNTTHHWHECSASGCPITSNSDKSGYTAHVYDNSADTTCNICGYTRTVTPPTPSSDKDETYYISISKTDNGEVIPSVRYAEEGERVTLSVHPENGYKLDRLLVTNIRGREIALRDLGGGRYTFTMPNSRVSVDAAFTKMVDNTPNTPTEDEPFTGLGTPGVSGIVLNPSPMPFTDVHTDDWFYSSVEYMWKHYLMSGVSDTQFAPDATTSRAMIWTVLARMSNVRTDVNPGSTWYERGMLWAIEQGVTDGINPMGDISREQLATMLWRNAGSPGGTGDLSQFSDSGSVSDYALIAMRWAVANGVLQGSDDKLNPKGSATRAQVAAMVMRYAERIGA